MLAGEKQIAHELTVDHSVAFLRILADVYQQYDHRPFLCRLSCVEFEESKYLCATDGMIALFLPAPVTLDCGDYEGVPFLVRCHENRLYHNIKRLLADTKDYIESDLYEMDNVQESRAAIIETYSDGTELVSTDVLLAHIADGRFIFDLDKPHKHIVSRELYEYAFDAVGYFDKVRHREQRNSLMFLNTNGRGFALIMPINPDVKVKVIKGG